MVAVCAPARPIRRPNRPARMLPTSGSSTTSTSWVLEIRIAGSIRSALQTVDVRNINGAAVAEQGDQDRKPDGGLGRGHGEDEEHEHLRSEERRVGKEWRDRRRPDQ